MAISAAPLTPEQEKMAQETRQAFNRAAAPPQQEADARGKEKPQATLDREPPIQEKKEGAVWDRMAELRQNRETRGRDFDLSR